MHLGWGPEEEAFRAELVSFLEENAPPEARGRDFTHKQGEEGIPDWSRKWQATLFDHGWLVPGYPPELGGRNATPVQSLIYMEEMSRRGIPRSLNFPGYAIIGPSLREFGTDKQKELVRPTMRGDIIWCAGMSEPGAGSDLASLTTRAVLDGDHFVVNGQKVWTSYAQWADKCFCYVRTDPDAPKHKGISVLIIDMDTPGIDPRPLKQITGDAEFAEVFFSDVVVPKDNLVGELNDGWRITLTSLGHERGGLWVQGVTGLEFALRGVLDAAHSTGADRDPGVRRQLAAAYAKVASLRALGYKGFSAFAAGGAAPEHSYLKLASSETQKVLFELGMALNGAYGVVMDPAFATDAGRWVNSFFTSFASTIAGGTSEIQRNIISERILGLPRG